MAEVIPPTLRVPCTTCGEPTTCARTRISGDTGITCAFWDGQCARCKGYVTVAITTIGEAVNLGDLMGRTNDVLDRLAGAAPKGGGSSHG